MGVCFKTKKKKSMPRHRLNRSNKATSVDELTSVVLNPVENDAYYLNYEFKNSRNVN